MRKRLAARRHFAKRAGIVIMAVILAFCSHTLLFSGQEIHTLNDFKDAAAVSLYAFWFGEDAVTEDMEIFRRRQMYPRDGYILNSIIR